MADGVAQPQQKTSLTRTLRVEDELSFDNGRIRIRLHGWQGKRAILAVTMQSEVKVDKPPKPSA